MYVCTYACVSVRGMFDSIDIMGLVDYRVLTKSTLEYGNLKKNRGQNDDGENKRKSINLLSIMK